MNRLKRPVGRAVVVGLCCAGALLGSAVTAFAASDQIPRPPGAIDNRGWELVSTPDKNNAQLGIGALLSPDGNRVLYSVFGGLDGSPSGTRNQLLANRSDAGWGSTSIMPSRAAMLRDTYYESAATPDLSGWVASAEDSIGGIGTSPDSNLVRVDDKGNQTLLHTFPVAFGPSGLDVAASDDLRHVFVLVPSEADDALDPSHQPGTSDVYDYGSGTPQLISRMPVNGVAPVCGVDTNAGFALDVDMSTSQHWISSDGSKVFFASQGDSCGDPLQLYQRDTAARTTTLITGPVVTGDPDSGLNLFIQGAADGSWVIYRTLTSYAAADDVDGNASDMDLYRWTPAGGNVCLTCGVPQARLAGGFNRAVAAQDGGRAYFASTARLAEAPSAGANPTPNLYVVHDGTGAIHWIARGDNLGVTSSPTDGGYVTPSGNVLIFNSNSAGLDAVTGRSNGGQRQWYRYDDDDQSITCLSCPSGPVTGAVPGILGINAQAIKAPVRMASDDGSIVFFPALDSLVPEDTNNNVDLYEWHNGVTKLITSGHGSYAQNVPTFEGTTANGSDVLFFDSVNLTNDPNGETAMKLYDARVGGGFQPPPTPAPACVEDQCRSLPTPPPALGDLASETLRGAGNLTPPPPPTFRMSSIGRAQRAQFARTGRLTIPVKVNEAGVVSASATAKLGKRVRTVARASHTTLDGGTVKLRLRLSSAARKRLASAGKLKVTLVVTYSATGTSRHFVLNLKAVRHGR